MFAQTLQREALPVEEDPLTDSRNGLLRLIERRELRLEAVLGEGHAHRLHEQGLQLLEKVPHATSPTIDLSRAGDCSRVDEASQRAIWALLVPATTAMTCVMERV
jgi:hypothetical protein